MPSGIASGNDHMGDPQKYILYPIPSENRNHGKWAHQQEIHL